MLTYKTKHNLLASLHELTNQNTLQTGRFFCEIAKKSAQVYCFKNFVWVGNFAPIINRRWVWNKNVLGGKKSKN